jgi:hypothetical protein
MKRLWILFTMLSFMFIGCGPSARIQKTYIQMDQQKTGPIEVFNSFDEVGRPYKKVAELEVVDEREPDKIRDRMIESLKTKARKMGADCIVIVEEGTDISTTPNPFGGGGVITFYGFFIKCTAITFE